MLIALERAFLALSEVDLTIFFTVSCVFPALLASAIVSAEGAVELKLGIRCFGLLGLGGPTVAVSEAGAADFKAGDFVDSSLRFFVGGDVDVAVGSAEAEAEADSPSVAFFAFLVLGCASAGSAGADPVADVDAASAFLACLALNFSRFILRRVC